MADIPRVDPATAIAALRETRPPVTDPVTYLVMIENNFIPEILPTLQEILQDAELTQEIGWDLVHKLATLPGPESDACLETIARLGNPRDVILKVSEALLLLPAPRDSDGGEDSDNGTYSDSDSDEYSAEVSSEDSDEDSEEDSYDNSHGVFFGSADRYYLDADDEHRYDDDPPHGDEHQHDDNPPQDVDNARDEEPAQDGANSQSQQYDQDKPILVEKFVTLLGMLSILHQRLKTKRPSRFLAETLQNVHAAYLQHPTPEITAAVINLVHSLSGRRRPALPSRKSSINVANMDAPQQGEGQSSKNAPDPEDEGVIDQADEALQQRMLLSFVTCVLERYVNEYDVAWAGRLLEFYEPTKIVPRRQSLMAAFREEQRLQERDAVVGQLVALIRDLGLNSCTKAFLDELLEKPITRNPLSEADKATTPDEIPLCTGGCVSLMAYWVFSETIFDADQPVPDMHTFPDHFLLLHKLLADGPEDQIGMSPAVAEGLVTIGLWLQASGHISEHPESASQLPPDATVESDENAPSGYMRYLHLITLVALYHPRLHVRNAASSLAGQIFVADPSDEDRLRILQDLFENCSFGSLKALAVTWLRDAIRDTPRPDQSINGPAPSVFATQEALETLIPVVFPRLWKLEKLDLLEVADYFGQNMGFLLQAANLGLFLFWTEDRWSHVLPKRSDETVRTRWFNPLSAAVERLSEAAVGAGELILSGLDARHEARLGPLRTDLGVLAERLANLKATRGFNVAEKEDRA